MCFRFFFKKKQPTFKLKTASQVGPSNFTIQEKDAFFKFVDILKCNDELELRTKLHKLLQNLYATQTVVNPSLHINEMFRLSANRLIKQTKKDIRELLEKLKIYGGLATMHLEGEPAEYIEQLNNWNKFSKTYLDYNICTFEPNIRVLKHIVTAMNNIPNLGLASMLHIRENLDELHDLVSLLITTPQRLALVSNIISPTVDNEMDEPAFPRRSWG